jgi:hypothetical protein
VALLAFSALNFAGSATAATLFLPNGLLGLFTAISEVSGAIPKEKKPATKARHDLFSGDRLCSVV